MKDFINIPILHLDRKGFWNSLNSFQNLLYVISQFSQTMLLAFVSNRIFYVFPLIFFLSCNGPKEKNSALKELGTEQVVTDKLQLDSFGYFEEVVGCSCYLALGPSEFGNLEFIFAEKYGLPDGSGYGFIKVDHEMVRLKVISVENDPQGKYRNVKLGNDSLEVRVQLDINQSEEPEVLPAQGTLQILLDGNPSLMENVVGVCAC